VKQTFTVPGASNLTSIDILVPGTAWDAEFEVHGTWKVEVGNASGILLSTGYTFNVPFAVSGGWMSLPVDALDLVEGGQYWFNVSQHDATVTRPVVVRATSNACAGGVATKGTGASTSETLASDVYCIIETEKEDRDAFWNEVSYTYNTLVKDVEFYGMGADDAVNGYTKVKASVLVEERILAVVDPRLSIPESERVNPNATLESAPVHRGVGTRRPERDEEFYPRFRVYSERHDDPRRSLNPIHLYTNWIRRSLNPIHLSTILNPIHQYATAGNYTVKVSMIERERACTFHVHVAEGAEIC
jgi:hypothetical protein